MTGLLAWEPPYAAGEALKRQKKKKKLSSNTNIFLKVCSKTYLKQTWKDWNTGMNYKDITIILASLSKLLLKENLYLFITD